MRNLTMTGDAELMTGITFYRGFPHQIIVVTGVEASGALNVVSFCNLRLNDILILLPVTIN